MPSKHVAGGSTPSEGAISERNISMEVIKGVLVVGLGILFGVFVGALIVIFVIAAGALSGVVFAWVFPGTAAIVLKATGLMAYQWGAMLAFAGSFFKDYSVK